MSDVSLLPTAALAALEQTVNAALALDPDTGTALERLDGRVIAIEIEGIGVRLWVRPAGGRLAFMAHYAGESDTQLHATPGALLRMVGGEAAAGMFSGEVRISGDVETGQRFQRALKALDIDWEEHLSRLSGDVLAHQAARGLRGIGTFLQRLGQSAGEDGAEYLQEEWRGLPSGTEARAFADAVDTLRDDGERLEARIARLERRGTQKRAGVDS